jgi:hypothetical protein
VAREQAGHRAEQSLIKLAPLLRKVITEPIGKTGELLGQISQVTLQGAVVDPGPNGYAKAGIVPPCGMKSCPRVQDILTLLLRRWQRPRRGNDVGVGESGASV